MATVDRLRAAGSPQTASYLGVPSRGDGVQGTAVPLAHEDYLARHGVPRDADALRSHALIGYDQTTPFIREAVRALPWPERAAFALRADSDVAQLSLIRAGAGIGMCQARVAARQPALRRILPRKFSMQLETWITMHENLRHSIACRTVFDALVEGLGAYIAAR